MSSWIFKKMGCLQNMEIDKCVNFHKACFCQVEKLSNMIEMSQLYKMTTQILFCF